MQDVIEQARYRGVRDREEMATDAPRPEPTMNVPPSANTWGQITACSKSTGLCKIKRIAGPTASPAADATEEWAWIGLEPWNRKNDKVPLIAMRAFDMNGKSVRWVVVPLIGGLGRYSIPEQIDILPDVGPAQASYCTDSL